MWNANTELAILMKALKGLPNNDALMRVLESNQRLLSTWPHSTGFFLPQHLKRPLTFSKIFQQPLQVWPWNQSSAGQQDNPRVCDIKTNKTTWVNSFYMASGTPMSGLFVFCFVFFFPSNYPRKKPLPPRLSINKNMSFTSSFATGWL